MTRCLLLVVLFACGGKQEAAPQPISNVSTTPTEAPPKTRQQLALEKMGEFRDAMCKCAEGDADCAKRVSDDMVAWSENQPRDKEDEHFEPNAEAEKLGRELGECMQKAMMPVMGTDAGP